MPGKFIFVSGLSGAGKSTMVRAVLDARDDFRPVVTCTTRPRRAEEIDTFEYWFASEEEYEALKVKSNNWDETIYAGHKYGTDGERYMKYLRDSINIIVAVAPDFAIIQTIADKYKVDPVTIWIDTDMGTARGRTKNDDDRTAREENDSIRDQFDYIFKPGGNLKADSVSFVKLVSEILSKK